MHKIKVMFRQILHFLRYLICILLVAKIIHQNPMCLNSKITRTQIYYEYGLCGAYFPLIQQKQLYKSLMVPLELPFV